MYYVEAGLIKQFFVNLRATKGEWYTHPKVFSMSHFLHLEYNFDVLGIPVGGPFAHI